MKFYGVERKIAGVTLDNASANTTFLVELGELMKADGIEFEVEKKHFRCFSHILNLVVQKVLNLIKVDDSTIDTEDDVLDDDAIDTEETFDRYDFSNTKSDENKQYSTIIGKIRSLVKKIRISEQMRIKLTQFCDATEIKYIALKLDVRTRWNSTYDMLETAYLMRVPLKMMCECFEKLEQLKVTDKDWVAIEKIIKFLSYFKTITKTFSSSLTPTIQSVVVSFNILIDEIEKLANELEAQSIDRTDEALVYAFRSGRDKILQYYKKSNWIYCHAMVLDPRHKLVCFDKTKWGKDLKKQTINNFEKSFQSEYFVDNEPQGPSYASQVIYIYSIYI